MIAWNASQACQTQTMATRQALRTKQTGQCASCCGWQAELHFARAEMLKAAIREFDEDQSQPPQCNSSMGSIPIPPAIPQPCREVPVGVKFSQELRSAPRKCRFAPSFLGINLKNCILYSPARNDSLRLQRRRNQAVHRKTRR